MLDVWFVPVVHVILDVRLVLHDAAGHLPLLLLRLKLLPGALILIFSSLQILHFSLVFGTYAVGAHVYPRVFHLHGGADGHLMRVLLGYLRHIQLILQRMVHHLEGVLH